MAMTSNQPPDSVLKLSRALGPDAFAHALGWQRATNQRSDEWNDARFLVPVDQFPALAELKDFGSRWGVIFILHEVELINPTDPRHQAWRISITEDTTWNVPGA